MRRRLLLATAAATAVTAAALPAAAAHANTTCVGGPGCFPTLAAAVNDANAVNDADRIEIHAGTHQVPATVQQTAAGGPLEIDGAGRTTTFLESTTPLANHVLKLRADGIVSDLTVNLGAGDSRFGLDVTGGKVARVNVAGPNAGQSSTGVHLRAGADADQLEVGLAPSPNIASSGVSTDDDGDTKLSRIKVTADYGLVAIGQGDGGTTTLHSATFRSKYCAVSVRGMKLDADGVAADLEYPGTVVGVGMLWPYASEVALKHATLRGPREAIGIDLNPGVAKATSLVTAREVAISGPSTHARLYPAAGASATLDMAWSAIEPATITQPGQGAKQIVQGQGMVTGVDLKLPGVGFAPIPSYASPLVDAGEPGPALAPANLTDVRGFARVQDGNGDGTKVRDIGAVELVAPIKIPTDPPPTLP